MPDLYFPLIEGKFQIVASALSGLKIQHGLLKFACSRSHGKKDATDTCNGVV